MDNVVKHNIIVNMCHRDVLALGKHLIDQRPEDVCVVPAPSTLSESDLSVL